MSVVADARQPDAQQRAAIDAALERHENTFVTGPAGSGKSFTIKYQIEAERARGLVVSVCSSTGRSAVELGLDATTLHGFLALGDLGTRSVEKYVQQLESDDLTPHRLRIVHTDRLIIDEVSMLSASFLELAEAIVASIRRRPHEPWGGMAVTYSGDFAQLRPVPGRKRGPGEDAPPPPQLAFHAPRAWREAHVVTYSLVELHRQATDSSYGALLNRMRFATLTPADVTLLRSRIITKARAAQMADTHTFLYSVNADVDAHNARQLLTFDATTKHVYVAKTTITKKPSAKRPTFMIKAAGEKFVADSMRALATTELRLGCRVMLLANLDVANGFANGCTGTVVGFADAEDGSGVELPQVLFDNHALLKTITPHTWKIDSDPEWRATYEQVPLLLAHAISTHRSQGLTLGKVVTDASPRACFAAGMCYVKFSRVTRIDDIHVLEGFSSAAVYADAEVVEFYSAAA